jgi:hypothetical protein
MRYKTFRLCMLVGASALGAVAIYYFVNYALLLDIALGNSGIRTSLQATIRAMWLAFASQALLIGLLYVLVAFRPKSVSREVIVLFGLLQLLEAVLLFSFAERNWIAFLLVAAALCVLLGAALWPKQWPLATPDTLVTAQEAPLREPPAPPPL